MVPFRRALPRAAKSSPGQFVAADPALTLDALIYESKAPDILNRLEALPPGENPWFTQYYRIDHVKERDRKPFIQ